MKIIAVCNQKGGVGKTTTVMNLAAALSRSNTVLVVDVDPQESAVRWARRAGEDLPFEFVPDVDPNNIRRLRDIDGYDVVLVDTPGSHENTGILTAVLQVADLVILPLEAAPMAIESVADTIMEHIIPAGVRYRLLLNKIDTRRGGRRLAHWEEQLDNVEFIEGQVGLPRLNGHIRMAASVEDAPYDGKVVTQYTDTRKNRAAISDYTRVALELTSLWANQMEEA